MTVVRVFRLSIIMLCVVGFLCSGMGSAFADEPSPTPAPVLVVPVVLVGGVVGAAVSNKPVTVVVVSADPLVPLVAGGVVVASWVSEMSGRVETRAVVVDAVGAATVVVRVWKVVPVSLAYGDVVVVVVVDVRAQRKTVRVPLGAPVQGRGVRVNRDPAAVGSGVNGRVVKVGRVRRVGMTGVSWRVGCVPFKDLREVSVNYWGTDGFRYRGVLIVRADTASRVVAVFSDLYELGYRFHSVHPEDVYGRNPKGPGADDYASMRAGNTSMFNCRFVVGKESSRAVSPHSSGRSIDVNPWENPYVSRAGVVPNGWWVGRRGSSVLGLVSGSPVVAVLARHGFRWGASFGDYQHFDG